MSLLSRIFGKKKIDPNDLEAVVKAYASVLGKGNAITRDISELPLPKAQIAKALIEAIKITPDSPMREQLKTSFVMLGDFQDFEKCKANGVDPMKSGLEESEKMLAALQKAGF